MKTNRWKSIRMRIMNNLTNPVFRLKIRWSIKNGRLLFMMLLLLTSSYLYPQNLEIDKIKLQLKNITSDSSRIRLLEQLSTLTASGADTALVYVQNELKKAREEEDYETEIEALLNLGVLNYNNLEYDIALVYFQEGVARAKLHNLSEVEAYLLVKIGRWHRFRSKDSLSVLKYLNESLHVSQSVNHNEGIARVYAQLASFYASRQQVELSVHYLRLSKEYYLKFGDLQTVAHYYNEIGAYIWKYNPKFAFDIYLKGLDYAENYPNLKLSIGNAYMSSGNLDTALKYFKEALRLYLQNKEQRRAGVTYVALSEAYMQKGDYENANINADKCITLLEPLTLKQQQGLLGAYRIKGDVLKQQKKYHDALDFYEKSISLSKKIRNGVPRAKTNLTIGLLQLDFLNNPKATIRYCGLSKETAETINSVEIQKLACKCLYRAYRKIGDNSKALAFYEQHIMLKDSTYSIRLKKDIDSLSNIFKVRTELAEKNIELTNEKLKKQQSQVWGIITVGGVLISSLLLISWLIYKTNRQIDSKNRELEQINQSLRSSNHIKDNFIASINHQFRTPMNSIIGFSELLIEIIPKDLKDIAENINFASLQLMKLLKNVLQLAELQQGTLQLDAIAFDLKKSVRTLLQQYQEHPQKSSAVKLAHSYAGSPLENFVIGDEKKLQQILSQLLDNALKYTTEGEIQLLVTIEEVTTDTVPIRFAVKDTGVGISSDKQATIFESFSELAEVKERQFAGNGIGLAIASKLVKLHGSRIEVESAPNEGSCFFFTILYEKEKGLV